MAVGRAQWRSSVDVPQQERLCIKFVVLSRRIHADVFVTDGTEGLMYLSRVVEAAAAAAAPRY